MQKQLKVAERAGVVALARAFVVMHRLQERMLSEEKSFKGFRAFHKETKELTVPQALEQAGVDNVPLSEGFRIGVSENWRASIREGQKQAAFVWLRDNGKGDVIQPTINASTLSALAKELGEKNIEMPDMIFNVAQVPNTSVTKT